MVKRHCFLYSGTSDYFAVNHYTTMLVRPDPDANLTTSNSTDGSGLIYGYDPEWTLSTTAPWIYVIDDIKNLFRDPV